MRKAATKAATKAAWMMGLAMVLTACSSGAATKETAATAAPQAAENNTTAAAAAAGTATGFPEKAVDLVVPFKAGGNVDICARIMAPEMEKELGQPVNVLNKEGGGAVIGQTYALNEKPEGYTVLVLTSSYVTNVLSGATTYDMDSIRAIGQFCFDPEILVVSADSGITNYDEFLVAAKEKALLNSTPGFSTSHHICSLVYGQENGIEFEYMHTNGSAEQTVELAGGHADCGFTTYAGAASLIEQGKIIPIAVADTERSPSLPDVPTFKELGYDFTYGAYRGLAVRKDTPDDVVAVLSDAFAKAMATDEVKEQFANSGLPVTYTDGAAFDALLADDYEKLKAIQPLLEQ